MSWTYKWTCPECFDPVFVHECTCGSFVMFEQLGDDWPKHDCFHTQYRKLTARVMPILGAGADPQSATFKPFQDLKKHFGDAATGGVNPLPPMEEAPAAPDDDAASPESWIKRMDPMDESVSLIARVHDVQQKTRHIATLYESLGDIGRKLLGLPAESRARQITLVDCEGIPHESYTAIVDKERLAGIEAGVMVWANLQGRAAGGVGRAVDGSNMKRDGELVG